MYEYSGYDASVYDTFVYDTFVYDASVYDATVHDAMTQYVYHAWTWTMDMEIPVIRRGSHDLSA